MSNASIFAMRNRRTIRSPQNPMDKCTVVSIMPRDLKEVKPTIQPGVFFIPKGNKDNPSTLVVGSSSWWREIDEHQPLLEIPVSSVQIADSIVKDFCQGVAACNMKDSMPGLFFVQGEHDSAAIKKNFPKELALADKRQTEWFRHLIKMSDVLWARSNGNPLTIMDDARYAAEALGLKDKAWMQDFKAIELKQAPCCGALINMNFPVCSNCKTVLDVKKFESLGLKQAV